MLSLETDTWADKICRMSTEAESDSGDKMTLRITESDTIKSSVRSNRYYDMGTITVKAVCGELELTRLRLT